MSDNEELYFEIRQGTYRLTVDYSPSTVPDVGAWFWCLSYVKNQYGANDVLSCGRCKTRRAAKNVARNALRKVIDQLQLMHHTQWNTKPKPNYP